MTYSTSEQEFWIAYERIKLREEPAQEMHDYGGRAVSVVSSTKFKPYPFKVYRREEARVLEWA